MPEPAHAIKVSMKTAHRVELPARTEVIVTCKPTNAASWLPRSAAVSQPLSQSMALCRGRNSDRSCTQIGEAHVITKYDRVESLLPVTPRYDDDNEDSEDEGWLSD